MLYFRESDISLTYVTLAPQHFLKSFDLEKIMKAAS